MELKYVIMDEGLRFDNLEYLCPELPAKRREKIARYRFDTDKLRSLIAGLLIKRETGGAEIVYGEHEKPYLADGVMFFSVSHSGDIVAIAVDDYEVGCDVEAIPSEDRLKIADRFYHKREREYVSASDDNLRAFCRIWTRKEAYLKMTGEGISNDLTSFDVTGEPLSEKLYTLDIEGYCISVCSQKPINGSGIYFSETEIKDLI